MRGGRDCLNRRILKMSATTNHVFGAVANEFKNGINVTEGPQ